MIMNQRKNSGMKGIGNVTGVKRHTCVRLRLNLGLIGEKKFL
jgi:hypothetical protein